MNSMRIFDLKVLFVFLFSSNKHFTLCLLTYTSRTVCTTHMHTKSFKIRNFNLISNVNTQKKYKNKRKTVLLVYAAFGL